MSSYFNSPLNFWSLKQYFELNICVYIDRDISLSIYVYIYISAVKNNALTQLIQLQV